MTETRTLSHNQDSFAIQAIVNAVTVWTLEGSRETCPRKIIEKGIVAAALLGNARTRGEKTQVLSQLTSGFSPVEVFTISHLAAKMRNRGQLTRR